MPVCKNADPDISSESVSSGGGEQRYLCRDCGLNFVEGDDRTSSAIALKKALTALCLTETSFDGPGKIFRVNASQAYRRVKEENTDT